MHGNDKIGDSGVAQMRGGDRQRAYRNARSHSGRVRFAKLALPVIAVVVVLVAGGYMWLQRVAPGVALDLSGGTVRDGKLVMANPKVDGFTADDKPYSVRAARAIQDLTGTGIINLEHIQATLPMENGVSAQVTAPGGVFNSEANTLDFKESLAVKTTDGMRADFRSAAIDLATGSLKTSDPVRISMPGVVIEADRLQIDDNGARLLFESRVRLVVQPAIFKPTVSDVEPDAGSGG